MSRALGIFAVAAAAALGFAGGRFGHRSSEAPRPEASQRTPAAVLQACPSVATLSPDELRVVVRDELDRSRSTARAAEPEAVAEEPSTEQLEAASRIRDRVDDARRRGHWTEDDARAMRADLGQAPPQEREALMRALGVAINSGDLQVDTRMPF